MLLQSTSCRRHWADILRASSSLWSEPQVAFNPKVLLPLSHIGEQDEFRVQDASSFCALDERLSYWELLVCHPH